MEFVSVSHISVLMAALALTWIMFADLAPCSEGEVHPDDALELMMRGNVSYVNGEMDRLVTRSHHKMRAAVSGSQKPYAVILTCSDSRVPPEILFNKGLGDIFVIRVAGNVIAPHALGSIEYAVEHLGSRLIMVLGHSRCGAVTAAYHAHPEKTDGHVGAIFDSIYPAVEKVKKEKTSDFHHEMVEHSIDEHVKMVARDLKEHSPVINRLARQGRVKIVGAKYDLDDGTVRLIPTD